MYVFQPLLLVFPCTPSSLGLTQSLELNISQTCWESRIPFRLLQAWVQRAVWGEPTCFPFVLFRNAGHLEKYGFFLPPAAHKLGIWVVKAAACRLAHFPTQPFPRCSINSTPCFHQTGPLICPGGLQTASAQVGSPAGMPSLLSTFELCQLSQATSRNFLGISLSPPPTPSPTTA